LKTALMVIDVQPVFLDGSDFRTIGGDDLVAKCRVLIEQARAAGVPVVYVEHADVDDMPEGTAPEAKVMHPDLAPGAGDPVVHKMFGSGFMETTLDDVLKERGIRRFVACGLSSYGCVEATVLYGKLYGYDVAVAANAIAGPHSDEFPVTRGIPIFLDAWKKAGIEILESDDDPFAT